jgi:hypothetical protein
MILSLAAKRGEGRNQPHRHRFLLRDHWQRIYHLATGKCLLMDAIQNSPRPGGESP